MNEYKGSPKDDQSSLGAHWRNSVNVHNCMALSPSHWKNITGKSGQSDILANIIRASGRNGEMFRRGCPCCEDLWRWPHCQQRCDCHVVFLRFWSELSPSADRQSECSFASSGLHSCQAEDEDEDLRKGKQNRYITCLKHINHGRTWWWCWKVNNATFYAAFFLGVGERERLRTTAKFFRNAIIPWMLLKSFPCRSWSNRSCAAKVQNRVCWMVGKVQRGCYHPCSMSSRSRPPSSWSPRIVRPMAGRPVVRFPGIAISFFIGCFRGWKSGLRISAFIASLFLVFSFPLVLGAILVCTFIWRLVRVKNHQTSWRAFLAFLSFAPQSQVLSDHHSGSCVCSSPVSAFTFSPLRLAALEWSGLPSVLKIIQELKIPSVKRLFPLPSAFSLPSTFLLFN